MNVIALVMALGGVSLAAAGFVRLYRSSAPERRGDVARELLLSVAILALAMIPASMLDFPLLGAAIMLGYGVWLWRRFGRTADRE